MEIYKREGEKSREKNLAKKAICLRENATKEQDPRIREKNRQIKNQKQNHKSNKNVYQIYRSIFLCSRNFGS